MGKMKNCRRVLFSTLVAVFALTACEDEVLLSPRSEEQVSRVQSLRVATWNIHAGVGKDREYDLARTIRVLRGLDADVLGLQEVDVHWGKRSAWQDEARRIAEALDMKVFFAPIYNDPPAVTGEPRRRYGLAVLSRYPIVHTENHEITQRKWDQFRRRGGFPEVALDVRGTLVHFYVTHLDYRNAKVRRTQVAEMRRVLQEEHKQILVGDFNASPGAPELAPLWAGGLVDSWRVAGNGPGRTRSGRRIDYIAVSEGIDVTRVETIKTRASDHFPVVADLSITVR